jgi:hypothetical protein
MFCLTAGNISFEKFKKSCPIGVGGKGMAGEDAEELISLVEEDREGVVSFVFVKGIPKDI